MDKTITARLFRVDREAETTPLLKDVLGAIDAIEGYSSREKKLAPYFDVRLEFLEEESGSVLCGELLRIQSTNFPASVSTERRKALDTQHRLGHSIVFRYNHQLGVLGIQYDPRVCGPGRLFSYVREFDPLASYRIQPIMRDAAWERFARGAVKKLQVRVANPASLKPLDGEAAAVSTAIAAMGTAYNAPKITIEVSMGHSPGYLAGAKDLISQFLGASDKGDAQLEKLKVYTEDEDLPIDFLGDLLIFKDTLEFHDRDPDVNFGVRRDYLKRVMHGVS